VTLDFADVKPSLLNWTVVGLMAVTFISFWKFILAKFNIGFGLGELFASI
jgi:hypothetical protein